MSEEPIEKHVYTMMNKVATESNEEDRLFDELNLAKEERNFIRIDEDSIFFGFPFSIGRIRIGGKDASFDAKLKYDLYEHIVYFFSNRY